MEDFKGFIALFVVLTIIACCIGNYVNKESCLTRYEYYYPQYSLIAGCRITVNGILSPVDRVIFVQKMY